MDLCISVQTLFNACLPCAGSQLQRFCAANIPFGTSVACYLQHFCADNTAFGTPLACYLQHFFADNTAFDTPVASYLQHFCARKRAFGTLVACYLQHVCARKRAFGTPVACYLQSRRESHFGRLKFYTAIMVGLGLGCLPPPINTHSVVWGALLPIWVCIAMAS